MTEDTLSGRLIDGIVDDREESDKEVDDMMDAIFKKTPAEKLALLKSLQGTEDKAIRADLIKQALGISLDGVNEETVTLFVHHLAKTYEKTKD